MISIKLPIGLALAILVIFYGGSAVFTHHDIIIIKTNSTSIENKTSTTLTCDDMKYIVNKTDEIYHKAAQLGCVW